jgi:hypothetical protein
MELNKKATGALGGCETVSDVDEIFGMFNITELPAKTEYLIAAMGGLEVFMIPGDGTEESKYDTILAAFLTEKQRSKEQPQ